MKPILWIVLFILVLLGLWYLFTKHKQNMKVKMNHFLNKKNVKTHKQYKTKEFFSTDDKDLFENPKFISNSTIETSKDWPNGEGWSLFSGSGTDFYKLFNKNIKDSYWYGDTPSYITIKFPHKVILHKYSFYLTMKEIPFSNLTQGKQYRIKTVGTTNFKTIGAENNKDGEDFTYNGAATPSGTGKVYDTTTVHNQPNRWIVRGVFTTNLPTTGSKKWEIIDDRSSGGGGKNDGYINQGNARGQLQLPDTEYKFTVNNLKPVNYIQFQIIEANAPNYFFEANQIKLFVKKTAECQTGTAKTDKNVIPKIEDCESCGEEDWIATKTYKQEDKVRNEGNIYQAIGSPPKSNAPTHTSGTANNWKFLGKQTKYNADYTSTEQTVPDLTEATEIQNNIKNYRTNNVHKDYYDWKNSNLYGSLNSKAKIFLTKNEDRFKSFYLKSYKDSQCGDGYYYGSKLVTDGTTTKTDKGCLQYSGSCLKGVLKGGGTGSDSGLITDRVANNDCGKCDLGYYLSKVGDTKTLPDKITYNSGKTHHLQCSSWAGSCSNGDLKPLAERVSHNDCKSCDSGYYLTTTTKTQEKNTITYSSTNKTNPLQCNAYQRSTGSGKNGCDTLLPQKYMTKNMKCKKCPLKYSSFEPSTFGTDTTIELQKIPSNLAQNIKEILKSRIKIAIASGDNTKCYMSVYYGKIYKSTDSGKTWSVSNNKVERWSSIATNSDGSKVYAAIYSKSDDNINYKPLYKSIDYGGSWNKDSFTQVNKVTNILIYQDKKIYVSGQTNYRGGTMSYACVAIYNIDRATWSRNLVDESLLNIGVISIIVFDKYPRVCIATTKRHLYITKDDFYSTGQHRQTFKVTSIQNPRLIGSLGAPYYLAYGNNQTIRFYLNQVYHGSFPNTGSSYPLNFTQSSKFNHLSRSTDVCNTAQTVTSVQDTPTSSKYEQNTPDTLFFTKGKSAKGNTSFYVAYLKNIHTPIIRISNDNGANWFDINYLNLNAGTGVKCYTTGIAVSSDNKKLIVTYQFEEPFTNTNLHFREYPTLRVVTLDIESSTNTECNYCAPGYKFNSDNSECIAWTGSCTPGQLILQEKRTQNSHCDSSCSQRSQSHYLINKQCQVNDKKPNLPWVVKQDYVYDPYFKKYTAPRGSKLFTYDGSAYWTTYKWPVPNGVTKISIVAVGGGGGGSAVKAGLNTGGQGGSGGGLSFVNDITVTPGEELTVRVGSGGMGGVINRVQNNLKTKYFYFDGKNGNNSVVSRFSNGNHIYLIKADGGKGGKFLLGTNNESSVIPWYTTANSAQNGGFGGKNVQNNSGTGFTDGSGVNNTGGNNGGKGGKGIRNQTGGAGGGAGSYSGKGGDGGFSNHTPNLQLIMHFNFNGYKYINKWKSYGAKTPTWYINAVDETNSHLPWKKYLLLSGNPTLNDTKTVKTFNSTPVEYDNINGVNIGVKLDDYRVGTSVSGPSLMLNILERKSNWYLTGTKTQEYSSPDIKFNKIWNDNVGISFHFDFKLQSPVTVGDINDKTLIQNSYLLNFQTQSSHSDDSTFKGFGIQFTGSSKTELFPKFLIYNQAFTIPINLEYDTNYNLVWSIYKANAFSIYINNSTYSKIYNKNILETHINDNYTHCYINKTNTKNGSIWNTKRDFKGIIYDFRIYGGVLTSNENLNSITANLGTSGLGGGGGGGSSHTTHGGGGGGGVGLQGHGNNGSAGKAGYGGKGGSGGEDGEGQESSTRNGGKYGGGGGTFQDDVTKNGGRGGHGGVRIIWGPNRSFPNTNTSDLYND